MDHFIHIVYRSAVPWNQAVLTGCAVVAERGSTSWTLEVCLPLREYAKFESSSVHVPPKDGDLWRINFSRVQYKVIVHTQEDGKKVCGTRAD